MIDKIEVTIDVIVHATEDISKIFQAFEEMLELKKMILQFKKLQGILIIQLLCLNAKIVKKQAQNFIKKF